MLLIWSHDIIILPDITWHHVTPPASHHMTPHDIMWHLWHHLHHMTPHDIMWHHVTPPASHHMTPHDITWHHMTSCDMTSHDTMWYHMTSCDTAWHHVTSCDTAWHHVTCDTTWHHVISQTSSPFPPSGHKKGFLFKKKKVDNVWQSRFFVLDGDTLRYFKKITVSLHCCLTLFKKLLGAFSYDLCHGIHLGTYVPHRESCMLYEYHYDHVGLALISIVYSIQKWREKIKFLLSYEWRHSQNGVHSVCATNYLVLQFHWWIMCSHLCVVCVVCASLRCHVRQACAF